MKIVKNMWKKVLIIVVLLAIVAGILIVSPNFKKDPNEGKIGLIINNNNVTSKLKQDVFIDEKGVVYVYIDDMKNYFDGQIYYDKDNNQVITASDTKVAIIPLSEKEMTVNGAKVDLLSTVVRKDGLLYIPLSELEDVYNMEIKNIDGKVVTVDSLDRELIKADASKNLSVKYNTKFISKTVDKVKKGEKLIIVSEKEEWTKVRTANGILGYVKTNKLANKTYVRKQMEYTPQIEGMINLVWDYSSEYVSIPDRKGTTITGVNVVSPSFFSLKTGDKFSINENAKKGGKEYVEWAHNNGYKVWAMFSNNAMKETTGKILNNFEERQKMIEKIVSLAVQYNVDGINVDFENMNMQDKNVFSRFIVELAPRLRECGIVTSVDVTAPDGSENWSLCFDRDLIAHEADYIVFMAYDQHGASSTSAGTTAGADWVEANIKKFLGQEEVDKEKIILGMPLYTRLWKTDSAGKTTSSVVNMNDIDKKLPQNVTKTWDDSKKQYYVEYEEKGNKYQMWIEDEKSIREKLNLINQYELVGGAFWEKDRETEGVWDIAKEVLGTN